MKYKITAQSVGYLEDIIEADNEDEAQKIMDEMLENGAMTETHGSIELKNIELLEV